MKTPYQVSRDLDELPKKIRELQQRIDAAPEGGIYCSYIHGKQRYYNVKNGKKKYITEDNRQLALALARKHQDKKRLRQLQRELKAAQAYQKTYSQNEPRFRSESEGLLELLAELQLEVTQWENQEYEKNPAPYPGKHTTLKPGELVKSKAEAMIAILLKLRGIPYLYEKRLYESFPDFTIMHPLTGKIYYWEHFGMLDDDEYCRKAGMKMMRYLQDGISPASNLIITCEDSRHPLTVDHIIAVIDYYFGDVVWDGTIPESVEELLKTA